MPDHAIDPGGVAAWRPIKAVRVVALAIVRRDDHLLAVEVLDDDGALKGWRPLGGGVNFMEFAADASRREMREELGCDIRIEGAPEIYENLYVTMEQRGTK